MHNNSPPVQNNRYVLQRFFLYLLMNARSSGTTRTSCHKKFIAPYTLTFPVLGPASGTQWRYYKLSGGEPTYDHDGKFVNIFIVYPYKMTIYSLHYRAILIQVAHPWTSLVVTVTSARSFFFFPLLF